MKLSDNEIIKALERMREEDPEGFSADILDLINRLKAENESLADHNKQLRYDRNQIKSEAYKEFAERLKDFRKDGFFNLLGNCLVYSKNLKDYNDMRKGLKSEAIKEFAERLTGIFGFNELTGTVIKCHIDNLLAELTPTTLNKLPHNSLCETETYEG